MTNKILLTNVHICTLALWSKTNCSLYENDDLADEEAVNFAIDLSRVNRDSYNVAKGNGLVDVDVDEGDKGFLHSLGVETIEPSFKDISRVFYQEKLMPSEISAMAISAVLACNDSMDFMSQSIADDTSVRGKINLIQRLANYLDESDVWDKVHKEFENKFRVRHTFGSDEVKSLKGRTVFFEYKAPLEDLNSFVGLLQEYDSYKDKKADDIVRLLGVESIKNNNEIKDMVGR